MSLKVLPHSLETTVQAMYDVVERHFQDVAYLNLGNIQDAFDFVRSIPYKEDEASDECDNYEECIKAPLRTIQYGGDCDDKAVLLASFMKLQGIPYRIVTTSYNAETLDHVHTYIEIFVNNNWLPLDATYPGNPIFMEPKFVEKFVWSNAA